MSAVTVVPLVLLVLLPALAGGGLLVAGRRVDRVAPALSTGTAALVLALSIVVAVGRPDPVTAPFVAGGAWELDVDGLAALVLPTVAAVTLAVLVFATGDPPGPAGRFHGLMLLFAAAALATVAAGTLPTLLAAWEVMGATSWALIGFHWRDPRRVSSGTLAFVTTRSADLGLYLATAAALGGGTGLGLSTLAGASPGWRDLAAAGVLVAALGKAAQLPLSFWLSRAMDGPSPVSALLHSAAMVAMGGYLLLRVQPLLEATGWAGPVTAWAGAATAVVLGAVALAQSDLKQLLAASTSAQLGFVVLGAGVGATAGGASHLVAHAATKALLFLVAGAWLTRTGATGLDALRGVARSDRALGVAVTVGGLSLAGVVPLSLWATKDAVLAGALETSPALYGAGLLGAVLSAAYAGRMLALVWRQRPRAAAAPLEREQRRARVLQRVALTPLAIGAATLGVLALPPAAESVKGLLGASAEPSSGLGETVASAVLGVVVAGAAAWWTSRAAGAHAGVAPRPVTLLAGWLGLERAAEVLLVHPVLAASRGLARVDDGLDRAVDGAAARVVALGRRAAAVDLDLDRAVDAVGAGARALGRRVRAGQTGQLHQYYVQAVAVLAAATIVLVLVR